MRTARRLSSLEYILRSLKFAEAESFTEQSSQHQESVEKLKALRGRA